MFQTQTEIFCHTKEVKQVADKMDEETGNPLLEGPASLQK